MKYIGYTVYDFRKQKPFGICDKLTAEPKAFFSLTNAKKMLKEYRTRWPKRAEDFGVVGWHYDFSHIL